MLPNMVKHILTKHHTNKEILSSFRPNCVIIHTATSMEGGRIWVMTRVQDWSLLRLTCTGPIQVMETMR